MTMDVSMHSTIGNRMRMWPNRQRIGLRIRSASAGRDKRSGEFKLLMQSISGLVFDDFLIHFRKLNMDDSRVTKSVMGVLVRQPATQH